MFCTGCGKELNDKAVICPQCGAPTSNYNNFNQSTIAVKNEKKLFRTFYYNFIFPERLGLEASKLTPIHANVIFEDDYLEIQPLYNPTKNALGVVRYEPNRMIASTVRMPYSDIRVEIRNFKVLFVKCVSLSVIYQGNVYSFDASLQRPSPSVIENFEKTGTYACSLYDIEEFERIIRRKMPNVLFDLR